MPRGDDGVGQLLRVLGAAVEPHGSAVGDPYLPLEVHARLVLRDSHRFRRFVLLLLLVPVIVTDPATLPHLLTALLQHPLLR
ncbi:hypothetical protein HUO13_26420 [Saccharopolyspora erythraea]|uniref:hypothetical protein n=1 Tax=Saccharopolyspora erythraea TaxID=1836 RepID=UPI001BADA124|nr:hypothetical protein [Saccharopolyspora erythraea]QUH03879.1 hypothetical protein HUO13_26420 [Saccharopolyspora erythraea]